MVDKPPLNQVLRNAIQQRGYSIRAFAKICHEADPSQSAASWKRSLARYLSNNNPVTPTPKTAELLAKLLHEPRTAFVRPLPHLAPKAHLRELRAEVAKLRRENQRLRDKLAR